MTSGLVASTIDQGSGVSQGFLVSLSSHHFGAQYGFKRKNSGLRDFRSEFSQLAQLEKEALHL
jgi:hypothetical protein